MAPISVASKIKRHFYSIPIDQLVSTRDLLIHGNRGGVDRAINRLIKKTVIRRVANGVFIRTGGRWPTEKELAFFKAKSFGKEVRNLDSESGYFYCDGGSTSFAHKSGRIYLKGTSKKLMHFEDTPTGEALREVWARGKNALPCTDLEKMPWNFSREAKETVLKGRRWMPSWMADCFSSKEYLGPSKSRLESNESK